MSRRGYLLTLTCAVDGCRERTTYHYDLKRDYVDGHARNREHPWRCIEHANPDKFLTLDNPANSAVFVATEKFTTINGEQHSIGLYWVREGSTSGSGFNFSDAHSAYAKNFPAGTRLVVTAYTETPEQVEVARSVDPGAAS